MSWVLVLLEGAADPKRQVAGLPLCLRLALDAQAAKAGAIVLDPSLLELRACLRDPRLRIPVLEHCPSGAQAIQVPASFVVHRGLFKALVEDSAGSEAPIQLQAGDKFPQKYSSEQSARAGDGPALSQEYFLGVGAPWGFLPFDVIDTKSARRAEQLLFRALRKPQDGWTSRYLNRYLSLALSRWLVKTPLRPNQVSLGILAIGIAGALTAAQGGYLPLLIGALLFQAQSVLDGCDGEMSRITYRGSLLGEWLDTVGDDLTNYGFFAGAAYGLYSQTGNMLYLIAGVTTVLAGCTASGLEYRYLYRIGSGDLLKYPLSQATSSPSSSQGGSAIGRFLGQLGPLFKRDTFVFLTLLAAVFSLVGPMLILFALGALGILIGVIGTELRLKREGAPGKPVS